MLTDKASIPKGIRFWSVGIFGGLLVMLGASLYFLDQEKKEAEARLYETAEYVKVQSSSVTHYNEASESQALLRLIESVRQVGTNLKAEKEMGRSTEEALLQHPAVAECAVVGMPHPKWGEAGVACLVLRDATPPEAVLAALDGRLARYKHPLRAVAWEALPKSAYGKVPKALLRERLAREGVGFA